MGAVKEAQKAVDAARVQNVAERVAGRAHEVLKESVPEQVFQGGADFTHDGLLPPPRPGEALQAKANAILERLPTGEEVEEKARAALSNLTGNPDVSAKDTTFGEILGQVKKQLNSALEGGGHAAPEGVKERWGPPRTPTWQAPAHSPPEVITAEAGTIGQLERHQEARDRDEEAMTDPRQSDSVLPTGLWVLLVVFSLVLLGWLVFRHLTKPRRVGQPMLMDNEMGEGSNFDAGFMGGQTGARNVNPSQAQSGAGFQRF